MRRGQEQARDQEEVGHAEGLGPVDEVVHPGELAQWPFPRPGWNASAPPARCRCPWHSRPSRLVGRMMRAAGHGRTGPDRPGTGQFHAPGKVNSEPLAGELSWSPLPQPTGLLATAAGQSARHCIASALSYKLASRTRSSAGSERCPPKAEVTGSNPVGCANFTLQNNKIKCGF